MAEHPRQPAMSPQELKEPVSVPPSPPPAYAPPPPSARPSYLQNHLVNLFNQHPNIDVFNLPAPQASLFNQDEDDEDDTGELSPISIRISTAVRVKNNNNLVCLKVAPTEQAGSIADAVVNTIKQASSADGIPMIDENGRLRPILIEVDASMDIEGTGNVVGTEAIVKEIVKGRMESRKRAREQQEQQVGESSNPDNAVRIKRARSI